MSGPNLAARERFVEGQAGHTDKDVDAVVAKAAATAAEERDASVIVVLTSEGILVSKSSEQQRLIVHCIHFYMCWKPRMILALWPTILILAFCPNVKVAR